MFVVTVSRDPLNLFYNFHFHVLVQVFSLKVYFINEERRGFTSNFSGIVGKITERLNHFFRVIRMKVSLGMDGDFETVFNQTRYVYQNRRKDLESLNSFFSSYGCISEDENQKGLLMVLYYIKISSMTIH